MSAFALDDGVVHHTYSAYARGLDGLWAMYQWPTSTEWLLCNKGQTRVRPLGLTLF